MRFVSVLISASVLFLCLPAYSQDAKEVSDDREAALQSVKESISDLVDTATPLKGLKSIILAVTYLKDYKPEKPSLYESEILKTSTSKLRAAGFKVQTEPENIKMMDARMKAVTEWDGKSPLNSPDPEDAPMLVQSISAFKWIDNTTVVTTNTYLSETGYLARAPKAKRLVTSWTTLDIDTEVVDNVDLQAHLLKVTSEQINYFIRDWSTQNASKMQPRL
ncbi:hypothetical protein BH10CYA1_BH10CYA1_62220 [soil metagenome]